MHQFQTLSEGLAWLQGAGGTRGSHRTDGGEDLFVALRGVEAHAWIEDDDPKRGTALLDCVNELYRKIPSDWR